MFCGNYILHESEYDVHIFCVALDIIIYPAPHSAPSHGEGVWGFGKDAEIERPKALQDAKPSECPKGDRDIKLEADFENRLFLKAKAFTKT